VVRAHNRWIRLASFGSAAMVALAALTVGVARCQVYDPSLLVSDSRPEAGSGIGWWSGANDGGCFSAGLPRPEQRPAAAAGASVPPIYLAIRTMRLGGLDQDGVRSETAWKDIGLDLDSTCTLSESCPADPAKPSLSCKPSGASVPVDGNYCRDNTFGRLQVIASKVREVSEVYGLSDDAFNCALCVGAYNFIIKLSNYDGTPNDDDIRVDFFPSPGLDKILPWDCKPGGDWRAHPCFTADLPLNVQDTALSGTIAAPGELPEAIFNDAHAYVKDGFVVVSLPQDILFWFPGKKALATAFPLKIKKGIATGKIGRAKDGTWVIEDGVIAGRILGSELIESFRLIGFCESDPNYGTVKDFIQTNLDIRVADPQGPGEACDAISMGVGFTAGQATPGKAVHVDALVECGPASDGGADAVADAPPDG
jgi:hypothetical protein